MAPAPAPVNDAPAPSPQPGAGAATEAGAGAGAGAAAGTPGQGTEAGATATATAANQRPGLTPEALDFASRMFDLARAGDLQLVHYLAAGLPPNMANQRGDSLLMLAAYHGHEALVAAMLGKPPAPSAATSRTASGPAAHDADADADEQQQQQQPSDSGSAPLAAAAADAEHAIPVLPKERQPDVNQLNAKGQSILAGTVFKTYPALARLLVDAGADPLAGEPSAEETAKMFNKWEDTPLETGYRQLFEDAPGRGRGGVEVKGIAPVAS